MIEYIIIILALLTARNKIGLFLIKRKIKGIQKIRKGSEPFFLKGKGENERTGILLIHGFSSSPGELKELGKNLQKNGYTVFAPLLPGHGTSPEKLTTTKHRDWINECENGLEILNSTCENLWIIGNSMGANLAIITANKSKNIRGIVCISAPIIPNRKLRLVKLIMPIIKQIKLFQKKKYSKKFQERVSKKRKNTYNTIPVKSLSQLYKIVKISKKETVNIKKPILICQSHQDEVMDTSSAEYIKKKSKSSNAKILWIEDSLHSIILDPKNKEFLQKEIINFIKENNP